MVTNKLIQLGKFMLRVCNLSLAISACSSSSCTAGSVWDGTGFCMMPAWTGVLWQSQPVQYNVFTCIFSGEFWTVVANFLCSNVFWTLIGMGVIMIPVWLYFIVTWIKEGAEKDPSFPKNKLPIDLMTYVKILMTCFFAVFGIGLVGAGIGLLWSTISVWYTTFWMGYVIGLPLFCIIFQLISVYKHYGHLLARR